MVNYLTPMKRTINVIAVHKLERLTLAVSFFQGVRHDAFVLK
jgi:hypothetical protein